MVAAGIDPAAPADVEWLEECTASGERWAREQRRANGYNDDPDPDAAAPDASVKHGTVLRALMDYHHRGTYGGPPAFDGLGAADFPTPPMQAIREHLGIPRAVVDNPYPLEGTAAYRVARPWYGP